MTLHQPCVAGRVLGLDREPQRSVGVRGDRRQQVAQGEQAVAVPVGHLPVVRVSLLPRAPVEPFELGELEGRDDAAAVRRPVDLAVVYAHEVGVGSEAHIALERVGSLVDGPQVRLERVLRLLSAGPAVGDDERAVSPRVG
jgi:hypothetical protein